MHRMIDHTSLFITTLIVSFVLLVHNGQEPLFLIALSLIPVLLLLWLKKPSLWPLVVWLLVAGALGRYTRYFRQGYMSDAILAIRDYIGYFLAGKNVYHEMVMAQSGPTPFTYLPFSLFWYLPAQFFGIDHRWVEMLVSTTVPVLLFIYGRIRSTWQHLPLVAVVALTPFLIDLSSDGSNDNSAIFLLLASLVLFALAQARKHRRAAIFSAIVLACASAFKHYMAFFLIFFLPYLVHIKHFPIKGKTYVYIFAGTLAILCLPFILASPTGFFRSLVFIEVTNFHKVWGWNIWVALRDGWGIMATRQHMWLVRTIATAATAIVLFWRFQLTSLARVALASSILMLMYLVTSEWTTSAYFTFLIPLCALAFFEE